METGHASPAHTKHLGHGSLIGNVIRWVEETVVEGSIAEWESVHVSYHGRGPSPFAIESHGPKSLMSLAYIEVRVEPMLPQDFWKERRCIPSCGIPSELRFEEDLPSYSLRELPDRSIRLQGRSPPRIARRTRSSYSLAWRSVMVSIGNP
jgi:hypothetical protein